MGLKWSDFLAAVLVDLPVDNERFGIATGDPNFLTNQLRYAVIQIQQLIPFYTHGHETVYGAQDLVTEGLASVGALPQTEQGRPLDAYYKRTGRQCVSQPLQPYSWGNRYDLVCGNPRITNSQFFIAIDPWGQQFTVFPMVSNNHQISLTWQGVKEAFNVDDATPFGYDVVECVGLFVKAKIARLVDHDLAEYGSYMAEYVRRRSLLYADSRERSRLNLTESSPQPSVKCANSIGVCGDTDLDTEDTTEFCAFGDSGDGPTIANTAAVSMLVKSLEPDFVMHVGDCNYPSGDPVTIQDYLVKYYGLYVPKNFYLAFGNHDIETDGGTALKALLTTQASLNAGLTYYDFIPDSDQDIAGQPNDGFCHIFVLDTNGNPAVQGPWLQSRLAQSALWNIVVLHKSPFTSDIDHYPGEIPWRLAYKDWGAHIVISAHGHSYERMIEGGLPYIQCGLGGAPKRTFHSPPVVGSQFRYNDFYGSLYVTARRHRLQVTFYNTLGDNIDSLVLEKSLALA